MNERIHERVSLRLAIKILATSKTNLFFFICFAFVQFIDHLMAGMEDIIGKTGNYNIRDKFKRFDNKFIRPLLIRDLQVSCGSRRIF